ASASPRSMPRSPPAAPCAASSSRTSPGCASARRGGPLPHPRRATPSPRRGARGGRVAAMPRFAANLSMLYTELPFLERFAAAAADGFEAVEYLFPYDFAPADLAARLRDHGLQQVLFNTPP